MRRQEGFTLIELLVVISLAVVMLTLGASAVRHFWLVRSLEGGRDEVISQLRELQQRVVAETNPLVYGARFRVGSGEWGLVRYNIQTGVCTQFETRSFETGVIVSAVDLAEPSWIATCRSALGATDEFVFFFARGSATEGLLTPPGTPSAIELRQPVLDRTQRVAVTGITGRVSL